MYDMHYDLLTILYFNMTKKNKYSNISKLFEDLKKIYAQGNVIGGIINLYFMTPEEMREELDISSIEMVKLKEMFFKSVQYLEYCKSIGIILPTSNFLYGIEGCDYIENTKDLESLYELGLRSIIPVWNHSNQYGSGYRTEKGLTEKGKELIKVARRLNMIVDVSHANEKTFNDILTIYEQDTSDTSFLIASHSNVRSLCDRKRNLNDEQLVRLKNVGGFIGLFTNGNFLSNENEKLTYEEREKKFLEHLEYIIYKIKFPINRILVSTDDMNFHPNSSYHHREAIPIENISSRMFELISNVYGSDTANKILRDNALYIIENVKGG